MSIAAGQRGAWERVRRRVQDAVAGTGGVTLLTGPAGTGKTHLARCLADGTRADGIPVVWSGAGPGDAPAYRPWIQLLRRVGVGGSGRLAALVAGAEAAAAADVRARYALYDDVTAALAGCGPLLLVIDDLHLVDAASLLLLRHAAGELPGTAVAVVATVRTDAPAGDDEWPAVWPDLARTGEVVPVGPLTEPDVEALLAAAVGGPVPDGLAARVARRTRGNAFYVTELARAVAGSGEAGADALPPGVRAVVAARVAARTPACRRVLGAAAVIGRRFPVGLLAAVVGEGPGTVAGALDEAAAADLTGTGPGPDAEFVHEIVRDAVYDALPSAHRAHWHATVGAQLAATPAADAAQIADQYRLAGPSHQAQALHWSQRAGSHAMGVLAYEDAARHFGNAVDAAAGAAGRGRLQVRLGEAWSAAGRSDRARQAYTAAVADGRAAGDGELLARAALGLGAGPAGLEVALHDRDQIDALRDALALLGPDDVLRALVLARLSVALTFTEPVAARAGLVNEALAIAGTRGDPAARAAALAARCDVIAGPGHSVERAGLATEIVDTAGSLRDPVLELIGRRHRLVARLELGEMAAAEADLVAFDEVARALRQPVCAWYAPLWRAMLAELHGDVAGCERELAVVERIGAQVASRDAALLAGTVRWCLLAELGDPDRIRDMIAVAGPTDADGPWVAVSLTLVAVQLGELAEARVRADGLLDRLRALPVDSEWLASLAQAAEAVAEVGPRPVAEWLYDALSPYASRVVVEGIGAVLRGSVERHLGLLAAVLDRPADAAAHFGRAVAANRRLGGRLLVARTLLDAGRTLGDPELLAQARELYETIGAPLRVAAIGGIPARPAATRTAGLFRCDGAVWTVRFAGTEAVVRDGKGIRDLATLLRRPGRAVAAVDLAAGGGRGGPAADGAGRADRAGLHEPGDLGPVIDAPARAAYRQRLADLADDLAEAEHHHDTDRIAAVAAERDALLAQLAQAYGLGGRPRKAGSPVERARTTVTARIRDSIRRIEAAHLELGRHLRHSIRTGTLCGYEPEAPVDWDFGPAGHTS